LRRRDAKLEGKVSKSGDAETSLKVDAESEVDRLFFENYGKQSIHDEMIGDKVRVEAYRQAISELVSGKTVIDVGAGTGILSIMAAEAGASRVVAVEKSKMALKARADIQKHRLADRVEVYHGLAEDYLHSGEKADVVLSEWMGYSLINENVLASVLSVRDRCLKADGIMIPSRAKIFIAVFEEILVQDDPILREMQSSPRLNAVVERCSKA